MPLDELDNLVKIGRLKREPPDPREVTALVESGGARLKDAAKEKCRVLDDAHRKRNAAEYAGVMDINESLVASIIDVAKEVRDRLRKLVAR